MELKKLIIGGLLVIVGIVGFKAYSHSKLSQEEKVEKITNKMAKKLKLTDDQKAKVYSINLERAKGHIKAYEAGRKKDIILAAVKQWEADLKTVLTSEQLKKLKL